MRDDEFYVIPETTDYSRLRILENAVLNYSGGIVELEARCRKSSSKIRCTDRAVADVLNDVANYLRDIAVAGRLEIHGGWLSDE